MGRLIYKEFQMTHFMTATRKVNIAIQQTSYYLFSIISSLQPMCFALQKFIKKIVYSEI